MIHELSKNGIILHFYHYTGLTLSLNKGRYFEVSPTNQENIYYCFLNYETEKYMRTFLYGDSTNKDPILSDIQIPYLFSLGKLIAERNNNESHLRLMPSIMDILGDMETLQINDDYVIKEITKGRNVEIDIMEKDLSQVIILNTYSQPVALGKLHQSKFVPIVDLGYYLRNEG